MSNTTQGHQAEVVAADYLASRGYTIMDRNWHTTRCEIDIVARKGSCIYFVEVKYRASDRQGSGLDYLTASKLRRMGFAAELWIAKHGWKNEYCLSGIELSGEDMEVTDFIETLLA